MVFSQPVAPKSLVEEPISQVISPVVQEQMPITEQNAEPINFEAEFDYEEPRGPIGKGKKGKGKGKKGKKCKGGAQGMPRKAIKSLIQ